MLKKILFTIGLLAIASLIGFGIYYFFIQTPAGQKIFKESKTSDKIESLPTAGERKETSEKEIDKLTPPSTLPTASTLPNATKPSIYKPIPVKQAVSNYVSNPSINSSGNMRFYDVANGKFYKLNDGGTIKELSDEVFYNVKNVTWAKNQDKAILEYPDNSKIIYNFETKTQVATLPKHWQDFNFSPEGNQIVAKSIGLSPENRWLVLTNDDGTGTQLIEPLGNNADKVQINWSPNRQVAGFSQTGELLGFDRSEVLLVGLKGENFKSLTIEGRGFTPQWSPTGKKLVYSVYSNRTNLKPELWITTASGDNVDSDRKLLKIETWADKCVFGDDNTLFCAVPSELPTGAGMSRSIANAIPDNIYKIDLTTGLKNQISLGNDTYTVKNISYDSKTKKLFFTDLNKSGIFEASL